jgi:hypothetical protein
MASYYALRKMGGKTFSSSVGALIFTFALPIAARSVHSQLHYRFGIPLAIYFFSDFIVNKIWRSLLTSFFWLTWQFFASIYMGFFTLLMMIGVTFISVIYEKFEQSKNFKDILKAYIFSWKRIPRKKKTKYLSFCFLFFILFIALFYPYVMASILYGAKREWQEISTMLPRLQSYLISDAYPVWNFLHFKITSTIPMRHEHQMFLGIAPLFLVTIGFFVGYKNNNNNNFFILMAGTLIFIFFLTLYIGKFSLWYLVHKLPLFSAIRAITRIDEALLFPFAYIAMLAVQYFEAIYTGWRNQCIKIAILLILFFDFSMYIMPTSTKLLWRTRIEATERKIPPNLSPDAVIFMAQETGPFFADELDAMWVSMRLKLKTLNGYSGIFPTNFNPQFGNDCSELNHRIMSYIKFKHYSDDSYATIRKNIVPIGFKNCE